LRLAWPGEGKTIEVEFGRRGLRQRRHRLQAGRDERLTAVEAEFVGVLFALACSAHGYLAPGIATAVT
jgi:hypothetical protein